MKRFIYILCSVLFLSFSASAQVIKLDTLESSCKIDSLTFAKNALNYTLNGTGSLNVVIVGATKSWTNAAYTRFRKPDNSTFASRSELTAWMDKYFFVDASTSGSGGGGSVDLQGATDLGNSTSNAIQVTGLGGADITKDGAFMAYIPSGINSNVQFGAFFNGGTIGSQLLFTTDGNWSLGSPSKHYLSATGPITPFEFKTNGVLERVSGAPGTQDENFVTLKQFDSSINLYTGWAAYQDTVYTQAAPFHLLSGSKKTLPNRAQMTIESQKPIDVSMFYNKTDSTITGRTGDGLNVYVEFVAIPDASTTYLQATIDIGGVVGELYNGVYTFPNGAGVPQRISFSFAGYTLDTWQANGAKVKVMSDGNCDIYSQRYVLTRTHKAR